MWKLKPRTVEKHSSTTRPSAGIELTLLGCHLHRQKRHRRVASCQFYRLVITCQQVATNLSISSSCNKSVKIRLVTTCHLQTSLQLVETTCSKPVDNKF